MTWLVLGADRTQLRMILGRDKVVIDEWTLGAPAKERSELALINQHLRQSQMDWQTLDRLGLLVVPHSHTSVRVLSTLGNIWSWWSDRPVVHIETPELETLATHEIVSRILK